MVVWTRTIRYDGFTDSCLLSPDQCITSTRNLVHGCMKLYGRKATDVPSLSSHDCTYSLVVPVDVRPNRWRHSTSPTPRKTQLQRLYSGNNARLPDNATCVVGGIHGICSVDNKICTYAAVKYGRRNLDNGGTIRGRAKSRAGSARQCTHALCFPSKCQTQKNNTGLSEQTPLGTTPA